MIKEVAMRESKTVILIFSLLLSFPTGCTPVDVVKMGVAESFDGVPVSYSQYGKGDVTLVFIHGSCCDSRYWYKQIPFFARKYPLVTIDLAGHGHSGLNRKKYTLNAFGKDIKAVVDKIGAKKVILIGHSMGGVVIAEAALLMPQRVVGLIGVDTLHNVEHPFTQEEINSIILSLEDNFKKTVAGFVRSVAGEEIDKQLLEWVIADMSSTPPHVSISMLKEQAKQYAHEESAYLFDTIKIPVHCINSDLKPTDVEANRRHMISFNVRILKGKGHLLMLEVPEEFNMTLDDVIREILAVK